MDVNMLYVILQFFLILGIVVGWFIGGQELKTSKTRYPDQSFIKYWLG